MMSKDERLSLIGEKIKACTKCAEFDKSNPAPGSGNPNAKIVLLGEAEGQEEVQQGKPFVGRAGQLLTNILVAAQIDREKDVYITNICKCRPPKNRRPTDEEAKSCRKFLDLQLKSINPQYIVCLGSTAAQNLLGTETPISQLRGTWFKYLNAKVLCTFHPSYALRQSSAKHEIYKDLMLVLEDLSKN